MDPAECYGNEEPKYYHVPSPIKVMSNDEKEMGSKVNGHGQPPRLSESSRTISAGSLGGKKSPPLLPPQFQQHRPHSQSSSPHQSSSHQPLSPSHSAPQTLVHPIPAQPQSEPIYELEPEPVYENTEEIAGSPRLYENAQVSLERFQVLQKSPPPIPAAPDNLNDYEDMDVDNSIPPPLPPPSLPMASIYHDDYVDVDAHNTYVNPDELRQSSDGASDNPARLPPPALPAAATNRDEYIDMDGHNSYISPHDLRQSLDSTSENPTAVIQPTGSAISKSHDSLGMHVSHTYQSLGFPHDPFSATVISYIDDVIVSNAERLEKSCPCKTPGTETQE